MNAERELAEILHTLEIRGAIALQMLADPQRALAVIRYAANKPRITNPAAYAISLWRVNFDPRPRMEAHSAPPPPEWFELGRRLGASL